VYIERAASDLDAHWKMKMATPSRLNIPEPKSQHVPVHHVGVSVPLAGYRASLAGSSKQALGFAGVKITPYRPPKVVIISMVGKVVSFLQTISDVRCSQFDPEAEVWQRRLPETGLGSLGSRLGDGLWWMATSGPSNVLPS
jgi:hypothetical protein